MVNRKGQIIPLHITPCFYFEDIELDHNKILSEIKKIPFKKIPQGTMTFNLFQKGLYVSENTTNVFKDLDSGQNMFKVITNYVSETIKNIYQYDIDFKLATNWATKTEPNSIGQFHNHSHFWLTGCYYPEGVLEEKLYISFYPTWANNGIKPNVKTYNNLNSSMYEIMIKKGTLLIFPAELHHRIGYNNTNRNRYSIAFNILPKGKMGDGDGEYVF